MKAHAAPALYAELSSNNIDLCFVSESWLNKKILSHLICPDGYVMVRKDRNGIRAGGGVAVICRKDWKIKAINANGQFEFETLWCKITTPNSEFFAASVYHPPDPIYEPAALLNFLSETCDQILHDDPNAKIVIAGDINQLQIKDVMQQHGLHQMVKVPTRRDKILDVFLTNCPLLWKPGKVHKGLVRSDHLAVTVLPSIPAKPQRKYVSFRDTRDHRKIAMETKLSAFDWNSINNLDNPEESVKLLNTSLWSMFNESFPLVRVRVSSRDPPYMSPLVKHLCKVRNKTAHQGNQAENIMRQEKINALIRTNQVNAVNNKQLKHNRGSKGWWDTANRITGRKTQGTLVSSVISPNVINTYFQTINIDDEYEAPTRLQIPAGTHPPTVNECDV